MNKDEIEIKIIEYNSSEYKDELELRNTALRKPIGLSIYDEDLSEEKDDYHIGAFMDNIIVGTLLLAKINKEEIKMRQVAVNEQIRGKGIGMKLVHYAEALAKDNGYRKIIVDARVIASGFYEKLGYKKEGEKFIHMNIPHYKMYKDI